MSKNLISWQPSSIFGGHLGFTIGTFEPCIICMVPIISSKFYQNLLGIHGIIGKLLFPVCAFKIGKNMTFGVLIVHFVIKA